MTSEADLEVRLYGWTRVGTVNCIYEPSIADYVDDALDERARETFELHLTGCEGCRAIAEDFRAIRAAAGTLERHSVPPEVWTRIASAIGSTVEAKPRRLRWPWTAIPPIALWKPLAAGAFALLLAVVTWSGWRHFEAARDPVVALETTTGVTELPESVEAELNLAAEHYQKAIAGLEQIRTTQRAPLDRATSEILQTNLSVIDHAISESRAALATQPTSVPARESLFEALRSKVALLQDSVALMNEMSGDNQDSNPSGSNQ